MGPSLQLSTCLLFWGFLGLSVPAVEDTKPRSSSVSSQVNAILSRNNVTLLALLDIFRRKVKRLVEDILPTARLSTLTFESVTLKLVHFYGSTLFHVLVRRESLHAPTQNFVTKLAAATLTSDPLTLKLVHGVLVSQGPFLPRLVFVGLFVFPLGGGTGQTDRQTDRQDRHMMEPPSRKDGPIIIVCCPLSCRKTTPKITCYHRWLSDLESHSRCCSGQLSDNSKNTNDGK